MFEKTKRLGIIVYLYYNRDARKLNKYGRVLYHSHRMRYLVIYVDQTEAETVVEELQNLKFVKKAVPSYLDDIDQDFVGSLQR
ncbi:YlbG family protein [Streptococcus devriesei]|uniref:YlbG family protein n=1 Tax=Streptococcus devriesei TaxID=231233 RepID=UPI0004104E5C|nr:YlbG family protein [Streptococcus devriesei]